MTARRDIQLIDCARLAPSTSRVADGRLRDHRRVVPAEPQFDYVQSAIVPVVNPIQGRNVVDLRRELLFPPTLIQGGLNENLLSGFVRASTAASSESSTIRVCSASFPGWCVYLALCRVPDKSPSVYPTASGSRAIEK